MRKLLAVLMVASFATAASAAQLSLSFVGPGALDATNAEVPAGGTVTVQVEWTMSASEGTDFGFRGVSFNLTGNNHAADGTSPNGSIGEDAQLSMINRAASLAGFGVGGADGTVGGLSRFQVATAGTPVSDGGTHIAGTFDIAVDALASLGSVHSFYMLRNANALSPEANQAQGVQTWDFSATPAAGYPEYSIGNGFAGKNNGSGAIPMNITVTPEPAALALLALGGVAVLRRRS